MSNIQELEGQFARLRQFESYYDKRVGELMYKDSKVFAEIVQHCWEWIADEFGITNKVRNHYAQPMPEKDYVMVLIGFLTDERIGFGKLKKAAVHALRMEALANEIGCFWANVATALEMSVDGSSFDLGARTIMRRIKNNPSQIERLRVAFGSLPSEKKDVCCELLQLTV